MNHVANFVNDIARFFDTGLGLVVGILILLLSILWLLMPFAIIMIQNRITELVSVNRMILNELKSLNLDIRSTLSIEIPAEICPTCGIDILEGAVKCHKCGHKL